MSRPTPRLVLVAGATRTAAIDGISAAGASPDLLWHTPAADAEILAYGRPVEAPAVPASPTGCPTPAVVTRGARDVLGFETTVVDAGIDPPTAAPTVDFDVAAGGDIRETTPVPGVEQVFERARDLGSGLPDAEVLIGETIPGGTTTAMGTLRALGEPARVSSSLPANPTGLKRNVVAQGLDASGISAGDLAGDPLGAIEAMGDPVLAAAAGIAAGALETGTGVTLAGGTQMLAVAAVLRHAGVTGPLPVATTTHVADDESADFREAAVALDVHPIVTDPGFAHIEGEGAAGLAGYADGEAKGGVGMGGALALAARAGVLDQVRGRAVDFCGRLLGDREAVPESGSEVSSGGS
ncbi:MAG: nicotinate-nucleotide--dimethylbenzimidazole phosphoribosyltransferase [Halobacteriales archaeon]